MPLLPYDTLLIDSPLPIEQAAMRLQLATGPRKLLRLWPALSAPSHPFVGELIDDEFRIERAIAYQNSFLPRIRARLEPRAEGCRLAGTMSLHPPVGVFMLVWVGMVALIGVPATLWGLAHGDFSQATWIPPAMLVFGWALCSGAFTIEARIARKRLAGLLEGAVPER